MEELIKSTSGQETPLKTKAIFDEKRFNIQVVQKMVKETSLGIILNLTPQTKT